MLTFTAYVVGLSFNAFFPTLTRTLGFGYITTLLMSAPPWAFACVVSLINAWHADRTQERFWHIVGPIFGGLVGFIISMSTLNTAARYVALFLQASSYAGFIVFYSWISSSFPRPPAKRAVAIAMVNAFSQLGNIAGSVSLRVRRACEIYADFVFCSMSGTCRITGSGRAMGLLRPCLALPLPDA